jgi:hypothetical protein
MSLALEPFLVLEDNYWWKYQSESGDDVRVDCSLPSDSAIHLMITVGHDRYEQLLDARKPEGSSDVMPRRFRLLRSELMGHTFTWSEGLELPTAVGSHASVESQEDVPWAGKPLRTTVIIDHEGTFDPSEATECPLPHAKGGFGREVLIRQKFQVAEVGASLGQLEMRFVLGLGLFSARGRVFDNQYFKLRLTDWIGSH